MISLYKNIKEQRLRLGLTQSDLAQKLGYADKSMIAKIESGKIDLSHSKIKEFAKALGVTPFDLMGWSDDELDDGTSAEQEPYYINEDAREMAQFLFENPEYRVLFSAARNVSKEDLETVKTILDKFKGDNN